MYGYGVVVFLMVLVRLASADYLWAGFPNECPSDKRFGCSRIAESNPHAARHLTPLHLAAALPDVQAQAEAWVAASAQAHLLKDSRPGFLHARYLTWFWGFADDFMVSLRWVLRTQLMVANVCGCWAFDGCESAWVLGRW